MADRISTSWHAYPSLLAIGHRYLASLFVGPVTVEEKIDGSQFSFGAFGDNPDDLKFKSKGAEIYVTPEGHSSEKMFEKAVQSVIKRQYLLREGWTYRVEYLPKPKAVTLAYQRVPRDLFDNTDAYLIGYDVNTGHESYLSPEEKREEFARIGLETVPLFHLGWLEDETTLRALLENVSVLGGQQIEGVVVKNYAQFGQDGKVLIGKYVSKDFKETHGKNWPKENPKSGDIVQQIGEDVKTTARWRKGVQHLREAGKLTETPRDIALLFKEVPADILKEEIETIKDKLFEWAWPQISRIATAGMAEWYKTELAKGQEFGKPEQHIPRSLKD